MGTTTVRIDDDLLRAIKAQQQEDETLSDTIERLTCQRTSVDALGELAGLIDEESEEELRRRSNEVREELDIRMDRRTEH